MELLRFQQACLAFGTHPILDHVDFSLFTGERVCLVGRNGAGKSSLMRCVAGILPPTQGRIEVYGSVSTLLALGVGFNPSMSGRDNVYLGGLAAGMSREEIEGHFEEIADFSELGDAIDAPMRTYSSGMYARLAFSVAATINQPGRDLSKYGCRFGLCGSK